MEEGGDVEGDVDMALLLLLLWGGDVDIDGDDGDVVAAFIILPDGVRIGMVFAVVEVVVVVNDVDVCGGDVDCGGRCDVALAGDNCASPPKLVAPP